MPDVQFRIIVAIGVYLRASLSKWGGKYSYGSEHASVGIRTALGTRDHKLAPWLLETDRERVNVHGKPTCLPDMPQYKGRA